MHKAVRMALNYPALVMYWQTSPEEVFQGRKKCWGDENSDGGWLVGSSAEGSVSYELSSTLAPHHCRT